jgi:predicted short-subunit dehydrogenase-like oxidoreductase (DUF2520 family)
MVCMTLLSPLAPTSSPERPSIAVIGLGRVGTVLARALHHAGYPIVAVASRDAAKARRLAATLQTEALSAPDAVRRARLVILAISDDALAPFAAELAVQNAWQAKQSVVHVSGASPAAVLQPAAAQNAITGAFHPLAAFASPDDALPPGLTFAIEAPSPLRDLLHQIAHDLGGYPLDLQPGDKTLYHAAAVIASNYTVTLASLAVQILEQLGAAPDEALRALLPLMRTTLDNLERQGLPDALTGPLVRGDAGTVERHLRALDNATPEVARLYRSLAQGALRLAEQRGLDAQSIGELQDLISLPTDGMLERGVHS